MTPNCNLSFLFLRRQVVFEAQLWHDDISHKNLCENNYKIYFDIIYVYISLISIKL
jgi:hypothetical protein